MRTKAITVYESTLDKRKDDRIQRAKKLSGLLARYEEVLDLKERRETLHRMTEYQSLLKGAIGLLPFQADLQGRQFQQVSRKITDKGQITDEEALKKEGLDHVACGTVHAFQGDEKDVVLFSTAISDSTQAGTYEWLKNNRELINVAASRAKDQLIVLSDFKNLNRLHQKEGSDDLYELVKYVQANFSIRH